MGGSCGQTGGLCILRIGHQDLKLEIDTKEKVMDKQMILLVIYIVGLASVNIAAFRHLGLLGLFVTAASVPFAERILGMIDKL